MMSTCSDGWQTCDENQKHKPVDKNPTIQAGQALVSRHASRKYNRISPCFVYTVSHNM